MKLKCSCGGVAFSSRRRSVTQGDVTECAACGGAGHISVTDDYQDDAVATWHLTSDCDAGDRCNSIPPQKKTYSSDQVAALAQKFGHHVAGCAAERNFERECDCGLFRLRGEKRKVGA